MQFLSKVSTATRHVLFVALISSIIGRNLSGQSISQDVTDLPVLDSMHGPGAGAQDQQTPPYSQPAVPPPSAPGSYDATQDQGLNHDQGNGPGKAKSALFGSQLFAQPTIVAQLQSTNPNYLMNT